MTFSIDEARAGHALIQREVAEAEAAVASASGRRERRDAEARLDGARGQLRMSTVALESLAKQLGVSVSAQVAREHAGHPAAKQPGKPPTPTCDLAMGEALDLTRSFGRGRESEGDEFLEHDSIEGAFLYATGDARTGIRIWGRQDSWAVSIFSAARVKVRPSLGLYQYISRWRNTRGLGAPYVIEDRGEAAIMCERTYQSSQFTDEASARRMLTSTIDLVSEAAQEIARELAYQNDGGAPFVARGPGGLAGLLSWWEVTHEH